MKNPETILWAEFLVFMFDAGDFWLSSDLSSLVTLNGVLQYFLNLKHLEDLAAKSVQRNNRDLQQIEDGWRHKRPKNNLRYDQAHLIEDPVF